MTAFSSIRKYKKKSHRHSFSKIQRTLVISSCCFVGQEMYKGLQSTCTAIVLLSLDAPIAVAIVVYRSSLIVNVENQPAQACDTNLTNSKTTNHHT